MGDVFKSGCGGGMTGALAGALFEAPDDGVATSWVAFDQSSHPAGPFRRNQGCPEAAKGIEDRVAAARTVFDGVGYQGNRLDGRVHGVVLATAGAPHIDPGVVPN